MMMFSDGFPHWFRLAMLILQLACMGCYSFWFFRRSWFMWNYCRTNRTSRHVMTGFVLTCLAAALYMGFVFGQLWTVMRTDMDRVMQLWLPVCLFYLAAYSAVHLWRYWRWMDWIDKPKD